MTSGSQDKNDIGDVENFRQQETGSKIYYPGAATLGGCKENSKRVSWLEVRKLIRSCYCPVEMQSRFNPLWARPRDIPVSNYHTWKRDNHHKYSIAQHTQRAS